MIEIAIRQRNIPAIRKQLSTEWNMRVTYSIIQYCVFIHTVLAHTYINIFYFIWIVIKRE